MRHPAAPDPFTVPLDSSLGKALLGAKVGQEVEVVYVRTVKVLEIE